MPLDEIKILGMVFHFIGMLLLTLTYIKIAVLVHRISMQKNCLEYIPGTKLLLFPFLIALGAIGFVFVSLIHSYSMIIAVIEVGDYLRYFSLGVALVGNLLAFYAICKFYKTSLEKAKVIN